MTSNREFVHELLDHAAASWPDGVAIENRNASVTYPELRGTAIFYARWLAEQGVGPGDRVVVEAASTIETVGIIFGALALGAAFCPIHPTTPAKQRRFISEHSEAVLSVHREDGGLVAQNASGTVRVPGAEESLAGAPEGVRLAELCPDVIPEDLACLIYTSGSTGLPKGVTCLHRQVVFAVKAIANSLDYREDDKIFLGLPLSFDYGLYQIFLGIETGATLHLADPRSAGLSLLKELATTRTTILPAVPPILETLAVLARKQAGSLQSLRLITNTGAAAARATVQDLRNSFPNLRFQLMYGLTECKRATICPPDADLERPGTCGLPLRGTKVAIVDDAGRPLPPGEVGEIVIRGPHVMAGYWKDDEETANRYVLRHSTMRELRSGDYGWLDADGFLYCQGRRDDIFKQRGFRVSCSEIEAAACGLKGVNHAVLVPPAEKKPSVLFVGFDGDEFDVISRLRDELEEYKLPGKCISLPDFPTTPNGKFDRKALKALAHQ